MKQCSCAATLRSSIIIRERVVGEEEDGDRDGRTVRREIERETDGVMAAGVMAAGVMAAVKRDQRRKEKETKCRGPDFRNKEQQAFCHSKQVLSNAYLSVNCAR